MGEHKLNISDETLSRLMASLFSKIASCPALDSHLRSLLEQRCNMPNWLENEAILGVLTNEEYLNKLHVWSETAQLQDTHAMGSIFHNLNGTEKDFDQQLIDKLAELAGLNFLVKESYHTISMVPRSTRRQSPDISAIKENELHIVEIKRLRAPRTVGDHLDLVLSVARLCYPEILGQVSVSVNLPMQSRFNLAPVGNKEVADAYCLVEQIIEAQQKRSKRFSWQGSSVVLKKSEHPLDLVFRTGGGTSAELSARREYLVQKLMEKVKDRARYALKQIDDRRGTGSVHGLALLVLERQADFRWEPEICALFDSRISAFRREMKDHNSLNDMRII